MFGDNWKAAFAVAMLAGSATAFKVDVKNESMSCSADIQRVPCKPMLTNNRVPQGSC